MAKVQMFSNSGMARALAVGPGGRNLYVVRDFNPRLQYNVEQWDSRARRRAHGYRLTYVADDRKATANYMAVLQATTAPLFGGLENTPLMALFGVDVSPDGKWLALACGHDARLLQLSKGAPPPTPPSCAATATM
jgi:hypothetical protein